MQFDLRAIFFVVSVYLAAPPPALSQSKMGACDRPTNICDIDENLLSQWKDRSDLVVVDTRQELDYNQVHAVGALNLPLYAVKTKNYLRDKPILLMGEPFEQRSLFDSCAQLRGSGFADVKVLPNGLRRWFKAGGKLSGPSQKIFAKPFIDPQKLIAETSYSRWILVDASEDSQESNNLLHLNNIVSIPLHEDPESFLVGLRELLKTQTFHSSLPWVAIYLNNAHLKNEETLFQVISEFENLGNLFVVKGGRKAIANAIALNTKTFEAARQKNQVNLCR